MQSTLTVANVHLDPVSCTVKIDDKKKLRLATLSTSSFEFFMAHPERVFSRSQLLDKVWGDHVVIEERTVDVHVLRLRKVLKDAEGLIKTVRGVGYMLSGEISQPKIFAVAHELCATINDHYR